MSDIHKLSAEARTQAGKGAARAARREGKVPAVIYGDNKEPVSISLIQKDVVKALHQGGFFSSLFELDVDGKVERVIPRDVQFHPVRDWPMHVDFLRVSKNATITVEIPVHFLNEEDCPGLRAGGVLNIVRHAIEVNAPASDIPEAIEVDLNGVEVGESVHISAVTLPKGVTPTIDRDFTIATIAAPSGMRSETNAAKAGGDAEEDEE